MTTSKMEQLQSKIILTFKTGRFSQTDCIRGIGPAWSKYGRIFELSLLIHCHFGSFRQNSQYNLTLEVEIVSLILSTSLIIYQVSLVPLQLFQVSGPTSSSDMGVIPSFDMKRQLTTESTRKAYLFEFVVLSQCQLV